MISETININKLRSYANILSNSTFNEIVRQKNYSTLKANINKYDKDIISGQPITYQDYISHIFDSLKLNYRNEYFYKNLIINKILLEKYNLNTTTVLNEFRVNKSIADLVLINGTSRVFEIKTELDNETRLLSQINDYKRVFKEIYVVTHHSLLSRYQEILDKETGLIVLTEDFTLKTIKKSEAHHDLDNLTIFKSLRKSEYSNIIVSHFGCLPKVTDFKFYNACKTLILQIPTNELHDLMVKELKRRTIKEKEIFASPTVPNELKHICFCLDFDKHEYKFLHSVLNRKI